MKIYSSWSSSEFWLWKKSSTKQYKAVQSSTTKNSSIKKRKCSMENFFWCVKILFWRGKNGSDQRKPAWTLQKSINRRQVLGGGWGWRPLPNQFPCLTPPQTTFHNRSYVAQILILLNQQKRSTPKKSFQKMQARGKTCFLQHVQNHCNFEAS